MNEVYLLKQRINNLIKKYPNTEYAEKFEELLNTLNELYSTALINPKNNFLSRFINAVRAHTIKPEEQTIDRDKLLEIKERAIQLYTDLLINNKFQGEIKDYQERFTGFCFKKGSFDGFLEEYERYCEYKTRLKSTSEGKIEVYPWKTNKNEVVNQIRDGMKKISEIFFSNNISEEEAVNQGREYIKKKNKSIKDIYMKSDVTYCGDPEFICERSEYILECMEKIISDKDLKPENKDSTLKRIEEARRLVKEIEEYKKTLSEKRDNEIYDRMTSNYKQLLEFEDTIAKDIEQIWRDYLTNPKDYKEGQPFAFLVSWFTGRVEELKEINKCCCTLVTEKCMPILYRKCGQICDFKVENLDSMCIRDSGSWKTTKAEFFNQGMPVERQLINRIGNSDEFVWYEYPKVSKIILPTTMEQEMIERNVESNRGLEEHIDYTEFFMTIGRNGERIPVLNMFYCNEKGLKQLENIKNNNYNTPIKLDPSKGTIVQFRNDNSLDRNS